MMLTLLSGSAWAQTTYSGFTAINGTSGAYASQGYDKLVDGNTSTKWCVTSLGYPTYIEFKSDVAIVPSKYMLTTGDDTQSNSGRNPKSWRLYGKLKPTDSWRILANVSNNSQLPASNNYTVEFTINASVPCKYFRFEVWEVKSGTSFQLSEIQFKGIAYAGSGVEDEVTVCDGTSYSQGIPMYGYAFDDYTKSECIIPASELTAMRGSIITSIVFYPKSAGTSDWLTTHQTVFLKEVTSTMLGGSYNGTSGATIVKEGSPLPRPITGSPYVIIFDTPYSYSGGNLLIGVYNTAEGTYNDVQWYGVQGNSYQGASAYGNGSSLGSVSYSSLSFVPKTTFTYSHITEIASKADWEAFCNAVNSGYDYSGQTVRLTSNINDAVTTMCGTSSNKFRGIFDGQNHTINVALTATANVCAPFRYINGATIRNLKVAGTITGGSYKQMAGLVGVAYGTCNITNCLVSATITSSFSGDSSHSGFVMQVANESASNLNFTGCAFTGTFNCPNSDRIAGFVGWRETNNYTIPITITDCIFNPASINCSPISFNTNFVRSRSGDNGVTLTNSYYTVGIPTGTSTTSTQGQKAYSITGDTDVNVVHAYTANAYGTSGITVYKNGSTTTPGMLYSNTIYAGSGEQVPLNLSYTGSGNVSYHANNGTLTGSSNPYSLTMTTNNTVISAELLPVYDIYNNNDWNLFAQFVRNGHDYSGETVHLRGNVSITSQANQAGSANNLFKGTFEGHGHTITVNMTATGKNCAPFFGVQNAYINDLVVTGSITSSYVSVAGICGASYGSSYFNNCISKVNITSTCTNEPGDTNGYSTCGGFVGTSGGVDNMTFTGCAFTGSLTASRNICGGFVGFHASHSNWGSSYVGTSTYTDCLFAPSSINISSTQTAVFSCGYNGGQFVLRTITNCYYNGEGEEMNLKQDGVRVYSITGATGVTLAMNGNYTTRYNVSGIDVYSTGMVFNHNNTVTVYSPQYTTQSLILGGSATGYYLADHGTLTQVSGNNWNLAIEREDTQISASSCYPPTNLSASRATITWDGGDASYIVEVGETTTTTLENHVVLNEGFEDGSLPDGWISVTSTGNAVWDVTTGDYSSSTGAHSGSYNARCRHTSRGNSAYLITPEMDLSGATSATLKFWMINRSWGGDIDQCYVYYRINGGSWSEALFSTTEAHASWTEITVPLEGFAAHYQIGFYYVDCYGYDLGIDDVCVTMDGTLTNTTWTMASSNATSPYTFTGLEPGSTHLARVVSECSQASNEVEFTMPYPITKAIEGYGNGEGKWYLITSPLDATIAPTAVTNMIPTASGEPDVNSMDYDLYYFKQNPSDDLEWINYKESSANGGQFSLEAGKGYLYANKNNVTLSFTGVPYQGNGEVAINYIDGYRFSGWNLVGNPFNETATVNCSFYEINPEGTEIIANTSGTVDPMEGIFVIASENSTVTFTPASGNKASKLVIDITQGLGTLDRAVVDFKDNGILPKFQLNANHTKVYLPKNGKDYAVLTAESDMGEMPVGFKAERNGSYTLSVNAEEVSFAYLHLIDNMNGNDVDLLQTPYYTFDAKSSDYTDRFTLVFATGNDGNAFAYYNNGNWIINNDGNATLQVVDVTGHILSSETISGNCSKAINAASGVYMLRLINGNDVKVQKIVVRR